MNALADTPLVCSSACEHLNTRVEQMPENHVHHAREICGDCGDTLRWIAKPQSVERQRLNAFRLARLSMRRDLSRWETGFVASVSRLSDFHRSNRRSSTGFGAKKGRDENAKRIASMGRGHSFGYT